MGLRCAIALAFLLAACTASGTPAPRHTPSPTPSPPVSGHSSSPEGLPSQSQSPSATHPHVGHAPKYGPNAVSFVSAREGWALGDVGCLGCPRVFHTRDAGQHWRMVSQPALPPGPRRALREGLVGMYFANPRDGYIFRAFKCPLDCATVTRDGGRTWRPVSIPPVEQLVQGGVHMYATSRSTLLRNRIGSPGWKRLRLPARVWDPGIAAAGDTVVLLARDDDFVAAAPAQLGRIWVSSDSGVSWRARPNPCQLGDGGAALVSVARGHPQALLVDCFDNQQSSQALWTKHHLYGSADGGTHWVRLADPSHTGGPTLLADNGAGHAFLAVESGGRDLLRVTLDGARHWHSAITDYAGFFGWSGLRFISSAVGFILGPTHYAPVHLDRTMDGGRTWHRIHLPHATR